VQRQFVEDDYIKYFDDGLKYSFPPPPNKCPICNKHIAMKKHGFYKRYFITNGFNKKIFIRRYICLECGRTISYLPYFCTPFYQYYIELIIKYVKTVITYAGTQKACVEALKSHNPDILIERQHIYFYIKRFKDNVVYIQHGLRQLTPDVSYRVNENDKEERVRELIEIISSGFKSTHVFGKRFRDNCNRAFLGSLN
jgi:hypothetical protein